MAFNLKGRNLLTLLDFSTEEIKYLLQLSQEFKTMKRLGIAHETLKGKNIALLFEKDSTRTRCAFEVAAYDLGMHVTYLGPTGSQMGKKESIKDTARVLGRMYDGIEYRGFAQGIIEELGAYAGVPVWNGLTTEYHPTQILADFLTIQEKRGALQGQTLAFFGDASNNMGNSLMIGSAKMGLHFRAVAPREVWPAADLVEKCKTIAQKTGATITLTENVQEGAQDADAVYTDVWVSMGEPKEMWEKRIALLTAYRVTPDVMKKAKDDAIFMHCLPAFHNLETEIGRDIGDAFGLDCMEVAEEVFESDCSVVFDQSENRMHTIKAVMYATLL